MIKGNFTRKCQGKYKAPVTASRIGKAEQGVWQRRFWEHQISDEVDFSRHVEYIHFNPVKHGLADSPGAWANSSFHRYVKEGIYKSDWGADSKIVFPPTVGRE